VTLAVFQTDAHGSANTLEAAQKIKKALGRAVVDEDAEVLRGLIRVAGADRIALWNTYGDILRMRYDDIVREVDTLRESQNWSQLLEVKALLREFFEFSGAYDKGVQFGAYYVTALDALGRSFEAAWSKTKDIGYMNILAGRHQTGRDAILGVVSGFTDWSSDTPRDDVEELMAYAHRYLAISYHRDRALNNATKPVEHLAMAEKHASELPAGSRRRRALHARLLRNRGHLDQDAGRVEAALRLYETSLAEFTELEEYEHIAGTRLCIAKALTLRGGEAKKGVLEHLRAAEHAYEHLGSVEGRAKVSLQYAKYYLLEAGSSASAAATAALLDADAAASRATVLFGRLGSSQFVEDVASLKGQIQAQLHSNRAQ
jgi:hypothetical protein